MTKIKIITIGKTKEEWLKAALDEYIKRLSPSVSISWTLAKDTAQLEQIAFKENNRICLDPTGKMLNSEEFANYLHNQLVKQGSKLTFIIGGAEGIPSSLKENSELLSLSKMTFTHQMTRLILLEQIYRAIEINKGSGYHK